MISRRAALSAVAAVAGYLHGSPVASAQGGQAMYLVLDTVDVIVLRYRGRQININPNDVLDALGAPPPQMFQQQQQRGKQ